VQRAGRIFLHEFKVADRQRDCLARYEMVLTLGLGGYFKDIAVQLGGLLDSCCDETPAIVVRYLGFLGLDFRVTTTSG
jgi:hypothetical protein